MHRPRSVAIAAFLAGAALLAACTPAAPSAPPGATARVCNPWRGYVVAADHNYAGLGAYNGSTRFMCKDTPTQGVRAQMQHLRNYADGASTPSTLGNPFEPRPFYDEAAFLSFPYHGAAPTWAALGGKWAPNPAYGTAGVLRIYNEMRAGASLSAVDVNTYTIVGPAELTAVQMANRICAVGRCAGWRPEITPVQMAQLFLDEGTAAGVRGDVAFAQSILETGWFNWPSSPATAAATVEGTDGSVTPAPGSAAGDPVLDWYFELRDAASRE